MVVFEPWPTGVRGDRSAKCSTTTARVIKFHSSSLHLINPIQRYLKKTDGPTGFEPPISGVEATTLSTAPQCVYGKLFGN